MAIEQARPHAFSKPWGVIDLRPWSDLGQIGHATGEIWYERSAQPNTDTSLLLKLLFTNQPLSIQVHPDDAYAHSIGLLRGKSEAWYILSAGPDAKIALGLKQRLTSQQLRDAIDDGSISNLVVWHTVSQDEVIFVPAGTIHAIGAGLVIAELQQRSDATFRMYDYGRERELHIDSAVAVASTGPAVFSVPSKQLTNERTILLSNLLFVFERIKLAPNSVWSLAAERETWILVLSGRARVGSFEVAIGEAIFAQSDSVVIHAGVDGIVCLVAYTAGERTSNLLQEVGEPSPSNKVQAPTLWPQATAGLARGRPETIQ